MCDKQNMENKASANVEAMALPMNSLLPELNYSSSSYSAKFLQDFSSTIYIFNKNICLYVCYVLNIISITVTVWTEVQQSADCDLASMNNVANCCLQIMDAYYYYYNFHHYYHILTTYIFVSAFQVVST